MWDPGPPYIRLTRAASSEEGSLEGSGRLVSHSYSGFRTPIPVSALLFRTLLRTCVPHPCARMQMHALFCSPAALCGVEAD